MKFFHNFENILKNGFFLDFLFKNFIFFLYKRIIGKNFLYLMDKYFTEYIFFFLKSLFNYFFTFINLLKNLNFNQLIKIIILLVLQIVILIII